MERTNIELTIFSKEIETMRTSILEECKRQRFTINDFEQLVISLRMDLEKRQYEAQQETLL